MLSALQYVCFVKSGLFNEGRKLDMRIQSLFVGCKVQFVMDGVHYVKTVCRVMRLTLGQ